MKNVAQKRRNHHQKQIAKLMELENKHDGSTSDRNVDRKITKLPSYKLTTNNLLVSEFAEFSKTAKENDLIYDQLRQIKNPKDKKILTRELIKMIQEVSQDTEVL